MYPTARGGFGGRGRGGARGRGGYGRGGVRKSVPYRATRQWTRDGGSGDATVQIAGTQYRTTEDGNKLVKVQDDGNSTPKKAVVNGVPYIRSKSGNMLRSDKACPYFTRTGKDQLILLKQGLLKCGNTNLNLCRYLWKRKVMSLQARSGTCCSV